MDAPILQRLASVDWANKPEATIASQLIMPVLALLGYGEHTLHRVREQHVYKLRDPTMMKGSRKVKLDYEPRVYEEGLWVLEGKGTDTNVTPKTLGQVRDYAIHPEVRAPLMVTVDAGGFRVFDPWDEHWDEPILTVALNEVAERIDDLRAVLGADRVADVIRRRHFDHLRKALSASLEFGVLSDAEQEFKDLIAQARASIDEKRSELHRKALKEYDELHESVLRNSGVWGVAQHNNTPWVGSVAELRDFASAVLYQPEAQRPTQIGLVWPAIEAVYKEKCPDGTPLLRPLWWLHIVVLGGSLKLRGQPGCEPHATGLATTAIRDTLLGFPDDPLAAASWRLQRKLIPLSARTVGVAAPLEDLSKLARQRLTAEDRIRYRMDPTWFLMHFVRISVIDYLAQIDPWTVERLDEESEKVTQSLRTIAVPDREWIGPAGDPWLGSWETVDTLLECALATLLDDPSGDDLLADPDLQAVIRQAAQSPHELLRRAAVPLVERLGLA
jgi:hypothetical protein